MHGFYFAALGKLDTIHPQDWSKKDYGMYIFKSKCETNVARLVAVFGGI
jgi:hypothetical protein